MTFRQLQEILGTFDGEQLDTEVEVVVSPTHFLAVTEVKYDSEDKPYLLQVSVEG